MKVIFKSLLTGISFESPPPWLLCFPQLNPCISRQLRLSQLSSAQPIKPPARVSPRSPCQQVRAVKRATGAREVTELPLFTHRWTYTNAPLVARRQIKGLISFRCGNWADVAGFYTDKNTEQCVAVATAWIQLLMSFGAAAERVCASLELEFRMTCCCFEDKYKRFHILVQWAHLLRVRPFSFWTVVWICSTCTIQIVSLCHALSRFI